MIKAIFHPPSPSQALPRLDLRGFERALGPWGEFEAMLGEPALWLAAAGVALSIVLGIIWMARRRRDAQRLGPAHRRLARRLGLSLREARLLERLADAAGMSVPASILISKGCFDRAMRRGGHARGLRRKHLLRIQRRLHGA